jgi:hypothetical protein
MGVLSTNYTQIVPGALISASYVSDIYDVLMGNEPEAIIISGSLTISGSAIATRGFTGSLHGTASWAVRAVTSSYITSSNVFGPYGANSILTASYAISTSYANIIASSSIADTAISASYALSASYAPSSGPVTEYIQIQLSDETNSLTTGSAKYTFRMPFNMTLTEVRSSVNFAPSGSSIIVDINQSGTSILSTKLSIDVNEKTSLTAASPAVISTSALISDAEITLDIDQVGSAGNTGKGLKVLLKGTI